MEVFVKMMPLLIPILILDVALAIIAVIHVLRHQQYRFGNRTFWLVIVIVLLLFGPLIYFVFGKGENS